MSAFETFLEKLDLADYADGLSSLFARPKSLLLEGDKARHYAYIRVLEDASFAPLPKVEFLDEAVAKLLKFGTISERELGAIEQISSYFNNLKNTEFNTPVKEWLNDIIVPPQILALKTFFDKNRKIKSEADANLYKIDLQIAKIKSEISAQTSKMLHTQKLAAYLVDRQIHLVNDEECLLLRPGFNAVLRGQIISRSASGFFYVVSQSVASLREHLSDLINERETVIWQICKRLSEPLHKCVGFIKYIDRQYDIFDHYQARINFAKSKDLIFIPPNQKKEFEIIEFCHPSLENPKPINASIKKQITLITGVNAGGKTMLLKSILSASFMSKYVLPMRTNSKSKIASFGFIMPIVNDPQDVKKDISTFAGRIKEVASCFTQKDALIGIDEIELGTDSDEAAALFRVTLEELIKKGHFIIATTHHKKLAALMADNEAVELIAALYDEKEQKPRFEFLSGTIGKSYAFETAIRYKLPKEVVAKAKEAFGEDQLKLGALIEQSVSLQSSLKIKLDELDKASDALRRQKDELNLQKLNVRQELENKKQLLESMYAAAINEAKEAAKKGSMQEIHKAMNAATAQVKQAREVEIRTKSASIEFKLNDFIKYKNSVYQIVALDDKTVVLEMDGKRLRFVKQKIQNEATYAVAFKKSKEKLKLSMQKPASCMPYIDLHGYYIEDALEELDTYLSNAVLAGYSEVQIMHGMGSGKLARAVKEFLSKHEIVKGLEDAPLAKGGAGVSIVWL